MSFVLRIIKALWRARVSQFWPIWIGTTVVAAISVAWIVGQAERDEKVGNSAKAPRDLSRTPWPVWSGGAVPALLSLVLFLAGYIVVTLTWEDFAYYDDSAFTLFMLRGHNFGPPIWPQMGRFFPLGHQEFNLIRHVASTVVGYHVFSIIQLLILCCIVAVLLDGLSIPARAGLVALTLITPGVASIFTSLFEPERNVVFWTACLVLFLKWFDSVQSTGAAVAAAVCAQIVLYYKETAFLLLLGLAAGRFILRCRNNEQAGWDFRQLRNREGLLDVCLAALAMVFVIYYLAVMLPHPSMQYEDEARRSLSQITLSYIKLDLLAWLFAVVVLGRAYLIVRGRTRPSPLWDGLALGGLAYFAAYICLRLYSPYYLAPVDLVAVLFIGRLVALAWERMHRPGKVAVVTALSIILFQDISLSAFRLFERKNVIHAKAEMASVVEARYQRGLGAPRRLFFPSADPYVMMEFGSYLDYRGVSVEGAVGDRRRMSGVVMVGGSIAKDGPCVTFRSLICRAGDRPLPGDLVMLLPDDEAPLAEINSYRDRGDVLFSYVPYPPIPPSLYPLIRKIDIGSSRFSQKEFPDRWLHASIIAWK